jgi:hypothetical protein
MSCHSEEAAGLRSNLEQENQSARDCFASLAMTSPRGLAVGDLTGGRNDVLDLGQRKTLEVRGIR